MFLKRFFILTIIAFSLTACNSTTTKIDPSQGLEINRLKAEIVELKKEINNTDNEKISGVKENTEITLEDKNTDSKNEITALKKEIEDLKAELKDADKVINDLNDEISKKTKLIKKANEEKAAYSGDSFITLTSPENKSDHRTSPIEFKGKVSPNTEKIIVTATGPNNSYSDVYTLSDFKPGDTSFWYKADTKFNNLDYGTNEYEFKAYFKDGNVKSKNMTIFFIQGGTQ